MAISASLIVEVTPRLLQPGGSDLEFNGLILSKNNNIPVDSLVLPFADPESVGSYFGTESEIYRLANIYFLGYNNSFIKPDGFFVARYVDEDLAPWIRSGKITTPVAQIKEMSLSDITLTLGITSHTLNGLDFSSITSYSDAALVLQEAINNVVEGGVAWTGAKVSFSSLYNAFIITGGGLGSEQTVDYASGSIAEMLNLTLARGAILSQGANARNLAENMQAILQVTQNWVTFTQEWEADNDEMLAFAKWSTDRGVAHLYSAWSKDANLLLPNNSSNPATVLEEANVSGTTLTYGDIDYAVFIMGAAASIDFNRIQGVINFAFKSQPGLPASIASTMDAVNLNSKNVNYYGNFATRNDNFVFLYDASMFGDYRFIDPYVNAIWLNNALQVALMAGLKAVGRVPYTEMGYTLVRSWMMDPVKRALRNGIIDPGVELSELQKSALAREAGLDISSYLKSDGYFLQVLDPGPNVRMERGSPNVNLWYTYGGSINRLQVASTAVV